MAITQDLIVTISATQDGKQVWKYPLARLLVDDSGRAAVFLKRGQPPVHTFEVDPGAINQRGQLSAVRGSFRAHPATHPSDDQPHIQVTYRRRGASCGWALAKCNVKTPALERLWDRAAQAAPIRAGLASPSSGVNSPQDQTPDDGDQGSQSPNPSPASNDEIRAWAREHGLRVAAKGKLSAEVRRAYREAHELI